MRRRTRLALALGLTIASVAAVDAAIVVDRADRSSAESRATELRTEARQDDPARSITVPENPVVAAPTTTLPPPAAPAPPTTRPPAPRAAPAAPAAVATRRPIDTPADPYQKEPVRQIGTIEIPKIGLRHAMYEGISLTVIDHGPSHWPGTAMPGEPGNVVIAGHRVTHSRPFRNIDRLVPGDEVIFTVGDRRSVYSVTRHSVVTPSQTEIVNQTPDATATLFACHPPGSARYRYVVHLKLLT